MVTIFRRKIIEKGIHVKTALYLDYKGKDKAGNKQVRVKKSMNLFLIVKGHKQENKDTELTASVLLKQARKVLDENNGDIKQALETQTSEHVFLLSFIEKCINEKNKKTLYKSIHTSLTNFIEHTPLYRSNIAINAIDYNFLDKWKLYLTNVSNLNPNSLKAYFVKLGEVFNKAIMQGLIDTNPCHKLPKFKTVNTQKDILTIQDIQVLSNYKVRSSHELYKRAFLFSCVTGLRLNDLVTLKWNEIKDNQIQKTIGKVNEFVNNDLSPMAVEILNGCKSLMTLDGFVFTGLKINYVTPVVKMIVKQAGINKHITTHSARRTYASLLHNSGVDIYTLSKLMNHKSITTTTLYTQVSDMAKKQAVNKLPMFEMA